MRFFIVKTVRAMVFFSAMVFFVNCTNEVANATAGLINNDNFIKDTLLMTPVLTTKIVDTVRTNVVSNNLLGDYTNATFGNLKTSVVGQLLPLSIVSSSFTSYPLVRSTTEDLETVTTSNVNVVLEMPLSLIAKSDNSGSLELRNFVGDVTTELDISVTTFTTFLEEFDENGDLRVYYSDGTNSAGKKQILGTETLLGTKTGVRFLSSYTQADTLKINLNSYDFKTNFLEALDDQNIATNQDFKTFFKGLKITANKSSGNGCVISFDASRTRLKITYTNTNTDGTSSDEEMYFGFKDVYYNLYTHTHTADIADDSKIYVQGAGGYEVKLDLEEVVSTHSVNAKAENWLINQAILKVYVDDVTDNTLENFYIYGVKDDLELFVLKDYATFGLSRVDGTLRYEDQEAKTDPYIQFYITDYIKQILNDGEVDELRIKSKEDIEGANINLSSTNARHAVLLNDVLSTAKAPSLEIIYSKIEE